jgi:hypothetical protein
MSSQIFFSVTLRINSTNPSLRARSKAAAVAVLSSEAKKHQQQTNQTHFSGAVIKNFFCCVSQKISDELIKISVRSFPLNRKKRREFICIRTYHVKIK